VGDISRYGEGEALANFQRCLTEGPQLFERQTRRRDGSLFWAEIALRAAVISGEERVIAAVRDISTRKEAETRLHDSETRYDLLLRESPVGIMHLSADWTLSYCNDRFTEIISAPRSAIVGSDMRKLRDRSILPALTRALTGRDEPVAEYLDIQPEVALMRTQIAAFLSQWLPAFGADQRSYLTVAIGCTGGQHRSVYLVEQLALQFAQHLYRLATPRNQSRPGPCCSAGAAHPSGSGEPLQ